MPSDWIRDMVGPEARTLGQLAREKLLAGFVGLDDQAEAKSSQAWMDWMSRPGTGDEDPADGAEMVTDVGIEHYIALSNLKQGTTNLLAVNIWHLFEQRLEEYKRRCSDRYHISPIDLTDDTVRNELQNLAAVEELSLVANTSKHAEGGSAKKLREMRPDLFEDPILKKLGHASVAREVRAPFAGDGLYVTEADLDKYQAAIEGLWEEIAEFHVRERRGHREP